MKTNLFFGTVLLFIMAFLGLGQTIDLGSVEAIITAIVNAFLGIAILLFLVEMLARALGFSLLTKLMPFK